MKILIIEDDHAVRQVTRLLLEHHGYEILEAIDHESALKTFIADSSSIDLLLSDVDLPGKSGIDIVRELRALTPGIKVLFMTGHCGSASGNDNRLGEERVLFKPVPVKTLLKEIESVMNG